MPTKILMFNDFLKDTKNHNGRLSQWQCIIVNISSVETLWSADKVTEKIKIWKWKMIVIRSMDILYSKVWLWLIIAFCHLLCTPVTWPIENCYFIKPVTWLYVCIWGSVPMKIYFHPIYPAEHSPFDSSDITTNRGYYFHSPTNSMKRNSIK